MQVTIAAGIYPPDIGGPSTYAHTAASYLADRGDTVTVITYGNRTVTAREGRVTVHRIDRSLPKVLAYSAYLMKLFATAKSGVIFAQGPLVGGVHAYSLSKIRRIPYIVKITGDYAWERAVVLNSYKGSIDEFQSNRQNFSFRIRCIRALQGLVCRSAAEVITPSLYLRDLVKKWGVPKVAVIYNFFEPLIGDASAHAVDGRYIMTAGRLVPWKGFRALINIWPGILQEFPDQKLVIAGSGPDYADLKKYIDQRDLTGRVLMTGGLSRDIFLSYLKNADLFVLNSGYEGLSHTILEAQSLGVPCIVSDSGGNSELVTHHKTGLQFRHNSESEMKDCILRLLRSPQEAQRYASLALGGVARFERSKILSDIYSLVHSFETKR